jgi:hypothetical protein
MEQEEKPSADQAEKELKDKLYTVQVVETRLADPPKDLGEACCCVHALGKAKAFFRDATPSFILVGINHAGRIYRMERFKANAGPLASMVRAALVIGDPTVQVIHYVPTLGVKITRDEIECERQAATQLFKAIYYAGMQLIDYSIVGPSFDEEKGRGYYSFSRSKKFNKMREQVISDHGGDGTASSLHKMLGKPSVKVVGPDGQTRDVPAESAKDLLDMLLGGRRRKEEDDEEKDDSADFN